jgi:hypothetical protein
VFGRELRKEDRIEISMEFTARGMFPAQEEWFGFKVRYPTELLELRILFPQTRPPTSWAASVLIEKEKRPLPAKEVTQMSEGGRLMLHWRIHDPRLASLYVLSWRW